MTTSLTRRHFLAATAAAVAPVLLPEPAPAAERDRVRVALIGLGGRGQWFVDTMPRLANVVALCDVNDVKAADAYRKLPKLPRYRDFRKLLDERGKEIDGVVIATPDHTHAVAAALAMRMGKHVYCEKPLTHSLHEARTLRDLATQRKVATQMGNQGTASPAFRRAVTLIQAGTIGAVREVHGWNDGGGRGVFEAPKGSEAIPDTLAWDLWLGPAADRPYHPRWLQWHTWRDFATGQLGNWAVHSLNLAFMALRIDALWRPDAFPAEQRPAARTLRVRAEVSAVHGVTFPRWEQVRWDIPARGDLPPVTIHWHNGHDPRAGRQTIEDRLGRQLDWGDSGARKWRDHAGILVVGSKGKIHATGHNAEMTLLPAESFKDLEEPKQALPRSPGHEMEWLAACRGGPAALANFNYGGPLTEFLQLGNIATQLEGELEFDPVAGRFVNNPRADALTRRAYREGWTL